MGISPMHASTGVRTRAAHQHASIGRLAARFINKAQFDAGFAHGLILKDGAVPAIKDPGHDSELQMVSETASNVSVLLAIGASARHSLAPPTTRLHSLAPPTRHASRSSAFFGES